MSSFDFELLMLKPTPQEDLEKGIPIHFSQPPSSDDIAPPVVDRNQLLQNLLPALSVEWPTKWASKMEHQPKKEASSETPKEDDEEPHSETKTETKSPPSEKKNDHALKAYNAHKDTVRGRLVIQQPGSPWICPQVALWEGKTHDVVCVYTPVSAATFWNQMTDKKDVEMQHWEYVSGSWLGTRDQPSNFRQLADVDQEAIHSQQMNQLKKKYPVLNHDDAVPGDSAVVILDDVEDFCEAVLDKNVAAVSLYNHLMSSNDIRIVALTQYPCYRKTEALVHLFNLLHGYKSTTTKHRRRLTKKSGRGIHRKTRRNTQIAAGVRQETLLLTDSVIDEKLVSPMIVLLDPKPLKQKDSFFHLERCELTTQQSNIYRHETDAARRRLCCTFALENRPKVVEVDDVTQQTLYQREMERIVDEQDVSVATLEKYSPKFLRVLQQIQKESKGGILVYTHSEMDGQLFRSMLEHNGVDRLVVLRTEADIEVLENDFPVYLMIAPTKDVWFTGSRRLEHIHAIHLLDIPPESWVQTLRIGRKVVKPKVHLYVSTFSQKVLIKSRKNDEPKSKLTQAEEDDGSELFKYCKKYLGDVPATITEDEHLLEELLTMDRDVHKILNKIGVDRKTSDLEQNRGGSQDKRS
jgi:hypothetical protein